MLRTASFTKEMIMMIWKPKLPWKIRYYRVIVVERDHKVRQRLAKHYREHLEPQYAGKKRSVIVRVKNIADAQEKINGGFDPDLIIFSVYFPEVGRREMRGFLNGRAAKDIPKTVVFSVISLIPQVAPEHAAR